MIYLAFVRESKQYTDLTHQRFIVMRNCVTELYAMDTVTDYKPAIVYISQKAINVRNAMTTISETEIYNLIVST